MVHLTANIKTVEKYLEARSWLETGEKVTAIEVPGDGNMNFTLRVKTNRRSFIIKQSRDYVEKYPQVEAPITRSLREAKFYELVSGYSSLKKQMPNLLKIDNQNYVLYLEDLGNATDYTFLYKNGQVLNEDELFKIISFAADLHTNLTRENSEINLPNRKMRELNHKHIFIYPFLEENGLDLDAVLPGLQSIAAPYKNNDDLKGKIEKLGERYLQDGNSLLHGDYFPGSWIKTKGGIKIIDPEFCFFGEPEFEIGVTIAHLKMANQPEEIVSKAFRYYTEKALLNKELCQQFTAIEIFRRILGLAQLPLAINLQKRKDLLTQSFEILSTADY
ncbi:phosphotransferase [Salegentibacter sp. JZCK2]|uniref:phosphotransferase n=1 Tax=Salegentibacter tibetensis TaxID=2873600 RepID=UPI001CC943EF|nr:phosphotransferase [Salegentibacter tibetensis]MBZ9730869.1 phosphotransferase [Salegentibacter tibetensis]